MHSQCALSVLTVIENGVLFFLYFKRRYFWATRTGLSPVIAMARTPKRRIDNVLT